jgi:hypothetical protein
MLWSRKWLLATPTLQAEATFPDLWRQNIISMTIP